MSNWCPCTVVGKFPFSAGCRGTSPPTDAGEVLSVQDILHYFQECGIRRVVTEAVTEHGDLSTTITEFMCTKTLHSHCIPAHSSLNANRISTAFWLISFEFCETSCLRVHSYVLRENLVAPSTITLPLPVAHHAHHMFMRQYCRF